MIEGARIIHHVPGRVRIRFPSARRNRVILNQIREYIEKLDGVGSVEINTTTGSIVVRYDPEKREELSAHLPAAPEFGDAAELADRIEREAEFLAAHSDTAAVLVTSARSLDRDVRRMTGGLLDLKVLLPAALAIWALFEVGIDASTPMWVSLGIFSFNSFVTLHRPPAIQHTVMVEDQETGKEGS